MQRNTAVPGARCKVWGKEAEIKPSAKLGKSSQRYTPTRSPKPTRHVVGRGRKDCRVSRRRLEPPDSILVPRVSVDWRGRVPEVVGADLLVDASAHQGALAILVPVQGQDFASARLDCALRPRLPC